RKSFRAFVEVQTDLLTFTLDLACELVILPEGQCLGSCHKAEVIATESSIVLTRLPNIELWPYQRNRERQAESTDRFRHTDDIRCNSSLLEAEERSGSATAHLYIIDNEQDIMLAA